MDSQNPLEVKDKFKVKIKLIQGKIYQLEI